MPSALVAATTAAPNGGPGPHPHQPAALTTSTQAGPSSPPSASAVVTRRASSPRTSGGLAPPSSCDPTLLTSVSSVRTAIAELSSYSHALDARLEALLSQSAASRRQADASVSKLKPQVRLLHDEAEVLRSRLEDAAATATRLSSSVRSLDRQREKIARAKTWADRTEDLRASLMSLGSAIEQQDWDEATRRCIRAMSIDHEILHSRFAASVVPSTDYPEPPPVTLLNLRKSLLHVYVKRFEAAIEAKDQVEATRFFKMFPLVGWKAQGLQVYSNFARTMVRDKGKSISDALFSTRNPAPQHHSLLLTALFEHLALLIDQHQPLVDRHYGAGDFARGVMLGLQEECDRLGKKIVEHWWEDREMQRKISDVRSHIFTFVSQLGTASSRSLMRSAPGAGAKGGGGGISFNIPGRPSTPAGGPGGGRATPPPPPSSEQGGVDARDIDRVLGEMAAMANRWGTYRRFLKSRLVEPQDEGGAAAAEASRPQGAEGEATKDEAGAATTTKAAAASGKTSTLAALEGSALGSEILSLLEASYAPLEVWYLRSSMEKAHQLDVADLNARPYTSSVLDDVLYVVRSVLSRALQTCDAASVGRTTKALRWIVEEEYTGALSRRMDSLWKAVGPSMAVDGPRKEAATREMRTTFVLYLNVLSSSADYLQRILSEMSSEASLSRHFDEDQVASVASMVQSLTGLSSRMRSSLRSHMDLLFTNLTRPRIRAVLSDCYRDVHYLLDEDAFGEAEYQDEVRRRFARGWETVLAGYKEIFDEQNWEAYFSLALDAVVRPWEQLAMSMQFTELGALRFDKDLRSVSSYLSQFTTQGNVRDRFTRLQQMSYILNHDDDEGEDDEEGEGRRDDEGEEKRTRDLYESAAAQGVVWALSANEVRSVLGLRVA